MALRRQPPLASWTRFATEQVQLNRQAVKRDARGKPVLNGIHRLFVGQTDSGKTTLMRILTRMKRAVVVFGTKPGTDLALEKYVTDEGYIRVESWPPPKSALRLRNGAVRIMLWPRISAYEQLRSHAATFRAALQQITVEGRWTVAIDEGLWVCGKDGLGLGREVSDIAYGGRSNGISLHIAMQRPANVPVIVHSQCQQSYVFTMGNTHDLRELASYSRYSTPEVADAVKALSDDAEHTHRFLYLPRAGGSDWQVSEVPESWA